MTLANGASLDFIEVEQVHPQHYAFLVTEAEFDEILGRIKARNLTFWADPSTRAGPVEHRRRRPGAVLG